MAHEVVRQPASNLGKVTSKVSAGPTVSAKPQNGEHQANRKGAEARSTSGAQISEVSPQTEARIRSAVGSGRPLPAPLRDFFEPSFDHDLSNVRIHTDRSAASTSQSLQAAAFTLGSDIFFNAGRFSPHTATGFGLVAHELVHVAQQRAGSVSRLIQRAELPYHQLVWGDFVAQAPAAATESAGLWSSFKIPTPVLTSGTKDTKKRCKLLNPTGRRKFDTKFDGKGSVNPAQFDTEFQPYMETDKSWLQDRLKNNAYCNNAATQCERDFDQNPNVRPRLGTAAANRKSDCKTSFLRTCIANESTKKALLLKHEQGHFEITRVMAGKARDAVKAKAATFTFNASGCGHDAAMDLVHQLFQQPRAGLIKLGEDWRTFKDQVQVVYDHETTNSLNQRKQTDWEAKIAAGLTDYSVLPAAAPATPTQSPATPGRTTTPAQQVPAAEK